MNHKLSFSSLILILSISFVMFSCGKEETCTDGIMNQSETGIDCGGVCDACPTCDDGIQNGTETGVDCGGDDCDECLVGANGVWVSSGANIAPILSGFVSNLDATFNTDGTYTVLQTDTSGAEITLSGTYQQSESSVDGIWDITLNQSAPTQLTAQGIFSVTDNTMKYEVAQIEPAITGVTPPTAEGGFGSTSGGAFGTANVQTYVRK